MHLIITDGGDRQGTYGSFYIFGPDGNCKESKSFYLGIGDHNHAEYLSLLVALKHARKLGIKVVMIFTDSETVEQQLLGLRPLYNPSLKRVRKLVKMELEKFTDWEIKKVDRTVIYSFLGH